MFLFFSVVLMFIFWLSFWNVIVLHLVFCKMNFPHLTSFDQIVRTEIEYENRWDNYELRILPRFVKLGTVILLQECNAKIELSYQTRFPEWGKNHFGQDLRNKHNKKNEANESNELFHFFHVFSFWKFIPCSGRNGRFFFFTHVAAFREIWSNMINFCSFSNFCFLIMSKMNIHYVQVWFLHSVPPSQP